MTPSAHYMKERVSDRPDRLSVFFLATLEKQNMSTSTRVLSAVNARWCSTVRLNDVPLDEFGLLLIFLAE